MPITQQAKENIAMLGLRPERLQMLEELLERFIKEDKRQAIIFKAIKQGIPIFEGVYGSSTKEYGLQMDTIFQVCSLTKPVIAVLLLCLQEDGLIDLTEPVYKYLPEFDGQGREKICLWHLLTHSSGMTDEEIHANNVQYIEKELEIPMISDHSSNEEEAAFYQKVKDKMGISSDVKGRLGDIFYQISLKSPLKNAPRSHMTYCNYGYQRLKDVIDQVTGEPIDMYAGKRLFQPLGMNDTAWRVPEDKWYKIIGREEKAVSSGWFNSNECCVSESGSGGLKTTVEDMLLFSRMILNKGSLEGVRILSKASIRVLIKDHNQGVLSNGSADFATWALGLNLHGNKKDDGGMLRSESCLEHGGYAGTKFLFDPEYDLALACFTVEKETLTDREYFGVQGRAINLLYSALD